MQELIPLLFRKELEKIMSLLPTPILFNFSLTPALEPW
jgi:hypothetical protein